jgi:hypothetical protein
MLKRIGVFNDWLGLKITRAVGSMWCAYAFAALALCSKPWTLSGQALIAWIAQTFLQLVLLSIIIVGQDVGSRAQVEEIQQTRDTVVDEIALVREDHAALAELVGELHQFHIEGKLPDRILKP